MSSDADTSTPCEKEKVSTINLLREAVDVTIEKCLSTMRFQNFTEHYASIFSKHPQQMRDICDLARSQIGSHMQEEVKLIFEEEEVEELLKRLERLVEEQAHKKGTLAWRPSGNPRVDLADHYCDIKQNHLTSLRKHLRDLEAQNELLQETVLCRREEVLELYQKVQDDSKQFEEVMTAFEKLPIANLVEKLETIQ